MLGDRALRVKYPGFRDVGRAPHPEMAGLAGVKPNKYFLQVASGLSRE
jgi:hypothetical protein